MTINETGKQTPLKENEIIASILQNPEIRRDFLGIALLEEFIRNPNPNIANLFVFMHEYKARYDELLGMDEKDWNNLIGEMTFDGEKFLDFFMSLFKENIYGVGFLEDKEKRDVILNIVEGKEGNSLYLSSKLEGMLEIYTSEECEENKIITSEEITTFQKFIYDERIQKRIKNRLFTYVVELRKNLRDKLTQKVPELRWEVQTQVAQVVTRENKDL